MGLRELARAADVDPGYLSKLENGQRKNVTVDALGRIAKALGVPVAELLS